MSFELNTVKLPTRFEKIEHEDNVDSRFQKMKIYVAHTGVNLNNSIFSKEVLEKMLPTLSYMPILGYINKNGDEELDFRGHGEKLTVSEGKVKVEYITRAYGFVGEDHDAHFEISGGKEWLVCTGYLWTRFKDAIDIFNDSNGVKGQSMEVVDGQGYVDGSGRLVFTDGKFNGLCILGDDVPPAMNGATISMEFSNTDVKNSIQEMLAEFIAFTKGAEFVAKKKLEDETAKEEKTSKDAKVEPKAEPKEEKAKPEVKEDTKTEVSEKSEEEHESSNAEESLSENESVIKKEKDVKEDEDKEKVEAKEEPSKDEEDKKDEDLEEPEPKDEAKGEEKIEDKEKVDKSKKKDPKFSFDLQERIHAIAKALDEGKYIVEAFDDYVIYGEWEADCRKYFKAVYTVNADGSIKLGEAEEVFVQYLTAEEVAKVEAERNRISELENELKELRAFQKDVENAEKEELLKKSQKQLPSKKAKEIRSAFSRLTKEEVEKEIAYAIYQTNKNYEKSGVRAVGISKAEDFGFGTANELFHK